MCNAENTPAILSRRFWQNLSLNTAKYADIHVFIEIRVCIHRDSHEIREISNSAKSTLTVVDSVNLTKLSESTTQNCSYVLSITLPMYQLKRIRKS